MEESRNLKFSWAKECVKNSPPNGVLPHGSPFNSLREAETNLWQRLGAPQQNFFEQVVVGGYETLFSVGLEVLKSLHVDLTENSIEIYKKNDNGLKESLLQKCVITRI